MDCNSNSNNKSNSQDHGTRTLLASIRIVVAAIKNIAAAVVHHQMSVSKLLRMICIPAQIGLFLAGIPPLTSITK